MKEKPQFSLRTLLIVVAICAVVLGQVMALDVVLFGFCILLVLVYALTNVVPRRIGLVTVGAAGLLSVLPWIGIPSAVLIYPGSDVRLPVFEWPQGNSLITRVRWILRHAYDMGELPLHLLALFPNADDVIYFAGEGVATVRPFAVFVFWFGVFASAGTSVAVKWRTDRRRRRSAGADGKGARDREKEAPLFPPP